MALSSAVLIFLSTLSLRRATYDNWHKIAQAKISIHALLAESDPPNSLAFFLASSFLSTLSLRRATPQPGLHRAAYRYFYPRSPCGERRATYRQALRDVPISIHALLAESDGSTRQTYHRYEFLSTLSLRRATLTPARMSSILLISIHALLAESD